MANGLTFILELIDKMSGPARRAAGSLDALEKSLRAVEASQLDLGKVEFAGRGGGAVSAATEMNAATQALQESITGLSATIGELGKKLSDVAGQDGGNVIGGFVRGAASSIGENLMDAFGAAAADKIKTVGGQLKDILVTSFRENSTFTGRMSAFFDGVTGLAGERLSGLKEVWNRLTGGLEMPKVPETGLAKLGELGLQRVGVSTEGLVPRAVAALEKAKTEALAKVSSTSSTGFELFGKLKLPTIDVEGIEQAAKSVSLMPARLKAVTNEMGTNIKMGAQLTAVLGTLAIGTWAVVTAFAALATGGLILGGILAALAIGGMSLAISAAEAKGDTLDMLEAMLGSAEAAKNTYASIRGLEDELAFSMDQGQALAQKLALAGISNSQQLETAMRAVATVDSVVKGSGEKVQKIVEKAFVSGKFDVKAKQLIGTGVQLSALYEELGARTGKGAKLIEQQLKAGKIGAELGVAALSAVIDKKLGGLAKKQSLDFGVQVARMKSRIKGLFEDVNTGPFLEAFSKIVDLFGKGTVAGSVMHGVLTDVFDGLFAVAAKAVPYVRTALKGMLVVAMEIAVGFQPLLIQLGLVGAVAEDSEPGMETFIDGLLVMGEAAGAVASAFNWLLTTPALMYALGGAIFIALAPLLLLPAILFAGVAAWTYVVASFDEGWEALKFIFGQASEWGANMVNGLVDGILNSAGKLVEAVSGLAKKAVDAFRNIWQMRSPSKIGVGLGMNLGTSVSTGLRLAAKPANDNMRRLVSLPGAAGQGSSAPSFAPPSQPPAGQGSAAGRRGGQGVVVHVTIQSLVVQGAGGAGEALAGAREQLVDVLADVFEEAALKAGLDPTGTG